jgi:hypothetical protein
VNSSFFFLLSFPLDSFCLGRASSGLGKELAKRFYSDGYNLVLISSNETKLAEATEDIFREQLCTTDIASLSEANNHHLNALPYPSSRISFPEIPADVPDVKNFRYSSNLKFRDIQILISNLEDPSSPLKIVNQLEQSGIDSKVSLICCPFIFRFFVSFQGRCVGA